MGPAWQSVERWTGRRSPKLLALRRYPGRRAAHSAERMDTERTATAAGADPGPVLEVPVGGPPRRWLPWPARIALGTALVLVAAVIAGFAIRVPYTTVAPGEALSLPT